MDAHAGRKSCCAQTEAVLQRMEVPRAAIEYGGMEATAGDPAADLLRADPLQRVLVRPHDMLHPPVQFSRLARPDGQTQATRRVVAVDSVAPDAVLQQLQAFHRDIPGAPRILRRELLLDGVFAVRAEAHDDLPTVASRCAPAD